MVATPSLIAVVERDRLGLGRRETWMGCNFEAHEAVPSRITLWLRISSSFYDQLRDHVLVPDGAFYMRMNKDYLHQGSLFSTPELIELFICRGAQLEPSIRAVHFAQPKIDWPSGKLASKVAAQAGDGRSGEI
jgi:hypothetical protein